MNNIIMVTIPGAPLVIMALKEIGWGYEHEHEHPGTNQAAWLYSQHLP